MSIILVSELTQLYWKNVEQRMKIINITYQGSQALTTCQFNFILNRLQQFTNNNVCKVAIKTTSGLSTINNNETAENDNETEF